MNPTGKFFAGIDVGSRTTKAVLWNGKEVLCRTQISTAWNPEKSAVMAWKEILQQSGIKRASKTVVTGYGRTSATFADDAVTEITAHATGVIHQLPDTQMLIDIGGQDSKAISLSDGLVSDFAMNDRCAAGSGKFLEFLAVTMEMSIEEFAALAHQSDHPVQISSICTVFAETEILSLLAEGVSREDVACGVHHAIALRVGQMAKSLHPQPPVAFSGGVANNPCMVRELSKVMKSTVAVPPFPEYAGALGAAIIAERTI